MNQTTLLEILKEHAISRGYSLIAEDIDGGHPESFLPEMFMIADSAGAVYRVAVENVAGSD